MNKKYIVGGLIFWVGVSGYMGLRILESYTEDAVFRGAFRRARAGCRDQVFLSQQHPCAEGRGI